MISWATPEESTPSDAIFPCWARLASISRLRLMISVMRLKAAAISASSSSPSTVIRSSKRPRLTWRMMPIMCSIGRVMIVDALNTSTVDSTPEIRIRIAMLKRIRLVIEVAPR